MNNNNLFSFSPEPNLTRFTDTLKKKVASGRHSLRLGKKEKRSKLEALVEGSVEEKRDQRKEEEEVEQDYLLPAIPDVPLSGRIGPPAPSVLLRFASWAASVFWQQGLT